MIKGQTARHYDADRPVPGRISKRQQKLLDEIEVIDEAMEALKIRLTNRSVVRDPDYSKYQWSAEDKSRAEDTLKHLAAKRGELESEI